MSKKEKKRLEIKVEKNKRDRKEIRDSKDHIIKV